MGLVVEGFLDHSREADKQAIAFAAVGRSVHDGQSFWFEIGQRPENAFGVAGVRHCLCQPGILDVAKLMKQAIECAGPA